MKQVLTISILLLSLSAGMQDSMVLLLFKVNQSTIIQNFCINRDKPELGCNGKCHLKKQLDQQHEKDQAEWPTLKKWLMDFYQVASEINIQPIVFCDSQTNSFLSELRSIDYIIAIFHPPRKFYVN